MKLAFRKFWHGGVFDWLVALWTWSKYSHVELILDVVEGTTGQMFSSSYADDGVRFILRGSRKAPDYDYVDIPISEDERHTIFINAINELGKNYDLLGVFRFVIPLIHDDANDWFCSEICTYLLKSIGKLPHVTPNKVTPKELYQLVTGSK